MSKARPTAWLTAGATLVPALVAVVVCTRPVSAEIRFQEVSSAWGLEFRHHHGGTGEFYLIETMGSGVAMFDYDSDGDEDVLFVQSGSLPVAGAAPVAARSVLFRNDGAGRFVDVTAPARLVLDLYGMGATTGDVDGDGDEDLYVTAFGANRLLRNDGDGSFTDVTTAAGVGDELWGASAAFADADLDGDLDLYVTNYVDFSFDDNPTCGVQERGLRTYCNPDPFDGLADVYFRNRGDGSFERATADAGFSTADGKGLGVVFGDIDDDGWPDLYVANDLTPNFLFHNRGDGGFEEIALVAGTAYDERGEAEAGMGVELGDVDGNGHPDIIVTHVDEQTNALYANMGGAIFVDRRWPAQFAEASYYKVGFGVVLGDLDHDADIDVVIANGHIAHNADEWGKGTSYRQSNQVMENLGNGRFREATATGLDEVRPSRGMAAGDLDGDGDTDLVVSNSNDVAEVYENIGEGGDWLRFDLHPASRSVGSALRLQSGGRQLTREVRTASSYLSQGARAVHFGLGADATVDSLRVVWPGGRRQELRQLPVRRTVHLMAPLAEKPIEGEASRLVDSSSGLEGPRQR